MKHQTLQTLLRTAKGEEAPDAIIRNGKIVDVFTNSIDENLSILIKDGYIVSMQEDSGQQATRETRIIDAEGMYLCPGFIDSHTHIDSMIPFYEFVPWAIRGGTTTIISEGAMVAGGCGAAGLYSFVESTKGFPMRCYFVAPGMTPPFPALESCLGLSLKEFADVLKRDDFLGIGEAYWTRAVEGDDRIMKQAALAYSLGKTLEGHSSGARGNKLVQYLVTGVTSCHESVTAEEALEKLRLGIHVMIREGWVRKELGELSKLKDAPVDERRLILASDVFDPVMLYEEGYMDVIVRTAISLGFDPMRAIKMATINPADYFGLRHLGAIAPLRSADILFIDDLNTVHIEKTMQNGEIIYADGKFLPTLKPHRYPTAMKRTIKVGKLREADFRVKARAALHRVRVIDIANPTITKESSRLLTVRDGFLQPDLSEDVIFLSIINRLDKKKMGKGFIHGTGITKGAVALSVTWDSCNILVIGSSEEEMVKATNRLLEIQGGIVISKQGRISYEFPMPVYGTIPPYGIKEITDKIRALDGKLAEIGGRFDRPFLTMQTIPFTGLPFLRITDKGLADVRNKKIVSLFLD
jgi:adenine deaminase